MKVLKLDFSQFDRQKRRQRQIVWLLLCLFLLAFVISEYLNNQQQIDQLQNNHSSSATQVYSAPLSRESQQQMAIMHELIDELNRPWYQMLAAIETVKQANPDVFLNRLEPNIKKSEVTMIGAVASLDDLLKFMNDLTQQPIFYDVLLQNQQTLSDSEQAMAFTLKMRWVAHE